MAGVGSSARPSGPAPARAVDPKGQPLVSFFFNDHNASASYVKELRAFCERHDEVLVESLKTGDQLRIFQGVARGELTPEEAQKLMPERREVMDRAVLDALHGTGARVLAEPVHKSKYKGMRRRIDKELLPLASEHLSRSYAAFVDEGDADRAAESAIAFQRVMAEVHTLREVALVEEIEDRRRKAPSHSIGVIFGMFHTQPYHELKRKGVPAAREWHPKPEGPIRSTPYNRPLRAYRFGKEYSDKEAEKKDAISLILFYSLLDQVFKIDRFASEQTDLYDTIASRLDWSDWENLAESVSDYALDHGPDSETDGRLARQVVRWMSEAGLIEPTEKAFFKMR